MIVAGVASLGLLGIGVLYAVVSMVMLHTVKTTDDEVVPADVQALAESAGVDADVYALARVGASEAGGCKRSAKVAVMCVVVNHAVAVSSTPLLVILGSAETFGPQGTGGRSYVASSKDPQPIDLEIAGGVMDGTLTDNTGGALNFDSPRSYTDKFDADGNLIATAQQRADAFAAAREGEGKTLFVLDDVSESTFRFWRRA